MTARRRRQAVIALIAVALVNGVVYAAYTLPRSLEERRLAERKTALQQEVQQERKRLSAIRAQADVLEANRADVDAFYTKTVGMRTSSMVPVLQEVESLAREGGLHPGAASFSDEPIKGGGLERFVITMPVAGNYRQVVNFIQRLERSPYFLTLDEVQVKSSSGQAGQGNAGLSLVVSAYFRSPGNRPGVQQP